MVRGARGVGFRVITYLPLSAGSHTAQHYKVYTHMINTTNDFAYSRSVSLLYIYSTTDYIVPACLSSTLALPVCLSCTRYLIVQYLFVSLVTLTAYFVPSPYLQCKQTEVTQLFLLTLLFILCERHCLQCHLRTSKLSISHDFKKIHLITKWSRNTMSRTRFTDQQGKPNQPKPLLNRL